MAKPKILITAPTKRELSFLIEKAQTHDNLAVIETHEAIFYLLVSGIGSALTAFALGKILSTQHFDKAYQLGIAGSFNPTFPEGTLVKISSDTFADLYLDNQGAPLFLHDAGFGTFDRDPFCKSLLIPNLSPFASINLPEATAITVNTATGTDEKRDFWRKHFNPDIESMEGAAFYYACMMENIPCVQIRAVSNKVGVRNTKNWNITLAMQNLTVFFQSLLSP